MMGTMMNEQIDEAIEDSVDEVIALMEDAEINELLVIMGRSLVKDPENYAVCFRTGVGELENRLEHTNDDHIEFLVFFLKKFADDVWNNIAMEAALELDDQDQEEILKSIGSRLVNIGENIESGEYATCYEQYVEMTSEYLTKIETINEELSDD